MTWKKCPKCELNYIEEDKELCDMCKKEELTIYHKEMLREIEKNLKNNQKQKNMNKRKDLITNKVKLHNGVVENSISKEDYEYSKRILRGEIEAKSISVATNDDNSLWEKLKFLHKYKMSAIDLFRWLIRSFDWKDKDVSNFLPNESFKSEKCTKEGYGVWILPYSNITADTNTFSSWTTYIEDDKITEYCFFNDEFPTKESEAYVVFAKDDDEGNYVFLGVYKPEDYIGYLEGDVWTKEVFKRISKEYPIIKNNVIEEKMEQNNKVFDIIINLMSGIKSNNLLTSKLDNEKVELYNCRYLLSQVLRQYNLPLEHYLVSKKAYEKWSKIRSDNIFNYKYRDTIYKTTDDYVVVDKYKGSNKEPYEKDVVVKKGESFVFNDVFTDEHVVPINIIIKELLSLKNYDYLSIKEVLDKIYICKILKEEDYMIKNKSTRSIDYREVIINDYYDAGILIKNFDNVAVTKDLMNEGQQVLTNIEENNIGKKEETMNFKKCPRCDINIIKENEELCQICLKEINSKSEVKKQEFNIDKKDKKNYQEQFTFVNIQKIYRGKTGYVALNSSNEEVGIVFMCDDMRTPAFMHCELCIYSKFQKKYGEWHRIKSNGARIKWEHLKDILKSQGSYKVYID